MTEEYEKEAKKINDFFNKNRQANDINTFAVVLVLVIAAVFFAGCAIGHAFTCQTAITAGHAQYNGKTAKFEWLPACRGKESYENNQ